MQTERDRSDSQSPLSTGNRSELRARFEFAPGARLSDPIYLDYAAGAPLLLEAREAMVEATAHWANPSSAHALGRASRAICEQARVHVAGSIGAKAADIIFVSGGTEACNLGIDGLMNSSHRIVTTAIEHPAVDEVLKDAESRGVEMVRLPCAGGQPPTIDAFAQAIRSADLAVVQWVNHETGVVLPVEAYAAVCAERRVPLFVDAIAAHGRVPIDVDRLNASALALSGFKIGGPAGVGALWVRRGIDLAPQLRGGQQERGRRAGTPSPVAIAGYGAAARLLDARWDSADALAELGARLEQGLVALGAKINGAGGERVGTIVNASFVGWRSASLVAALDLEGICVSAGPACSSGVESPSVTISEMHSNEPERAASALRFSLGPSTTRESIDRSLHVLQRILPRNAAFVSKD